MKLLALSVIVGVLVPAFASQRALVLLQSADDKSNYSKFFGELTSRGFQLDVKGHKDSGLMLREYDRWLYDHLVLLAPKAEGALAFPAP